MSTARQAETGQLGPRALEIQSASPIGKSRPRSFPLPLAVVGALLYVGLVSLWLLYLRTLIPEMVAATSLPAVRLAFELGGEAGNAVRWASCVVGILLVTFLWLRWRGPGRAGRSTLLYLGTALVVLLVHLALVLTLDGVPRFVLTPL